VEVRIDALKLVADSLSELIGVNSRIIRTRPRSTTQFIPP